MGGVATGGARNVEAIGDQTARSAVGVRGGGAWTLDLLTSGACFGA